MLFLFNKTSVFSIKNTLHLDAALLREGHDHVHVHPPGPPGVQVANVAYKLPGVDDEVARVFDVLAAAVRDPELGVGQVRQGAHVELYALGLPRPAVVPEAVQHVGVDLPPRRVLSMSRASLGPCWCMSLFEMFRLCRCALVLCPRARRITSAAARSKLGLFSPGTSCCHFLPSARILSASRYAFCFCSRLRTIVRF